MHCGEVAIIYTDHPNSKRRDWNQQPPSPCGRTFYISTWFFFTSLNNISDPFWILEKLISGRISALFGADSMTFQLNGRTIQTFRERRATPKSHQKSMALEATSINHCNPLKESPEDHFHLNSRKRSKMSRTSVTSKNSRTKGWLPRVHLNDGRWHKAQTMK